MLSYIYGSFLFSDSITSSRWPRILSLNYLINRDWTRDSVRFCGFLPVFVVCRRQHTPPHCRTLRCCLPHIRWVLGCRHFLPRRAVLLLQPASGLPARHYYYVTCHRNVPCRRTPSAIIPAHLEHHTTTIPATTTCTPSLHRISGCLLPPHVPATAYHLPYYIYFTFPTHTTDILQDTLPHTCYAYTVIRSYYMVIPPYAAVSLPQVSHACVTAPAIRLPRAHACRAAAVVPWDVTRIGSSAVHRLLLLLCTAPPCVSAPFFCRYGSRPAVPVAFTGSARTPACHFVFLRLLVHLIADARVTNERFAARTANAPLPVLPACRACVGSSPARLHRHLLLLAYLLVSYGACYRALMLLLCYYCARARVCIIRFPDAAGSAFLLTGSALHAYRATCQRLQRRKP